MAKISPEIHDQQLYLAEHSVPFCTVGSAAWFTWLAQATHFRFASTQQRATHYRGNLYLSPISLRKERRRHGYYWYAYRRSNGQLHKRYVGRSAQLTLAKLDTVANYLHDCW